MDDPNSARSYATLLHRSRWFHAIPADMQQRLLDAATVRHLAAGERLFGRGDPPCGMYCIVKGTVFAKGTSEAGKEMLVACFDAPKWLGEMSLFDGLPRSQEVFAQKPATLLHVSQSALHSMLAQQPGYWHWFGLMLSYKLRLALLTIEDLSLQPAAARVARRLLQLAQGFGDSEVSRNRLHVHQEQLALMLSLSRQTINQILKEMEAQNLVKLSYGAIEIVDLDRLSATLAT